MYSSSVSIPIADTPPAFRSRLPVYALLGTGFLTVFGNSLTALAVPWFVLETTGSAARTGLTAAVTVIPMIIATFFGGALVDRSSHRALSIIADVVSGVTVAAIPILYFTVGLSFPGLLGLMFLGAILDGPGGTARTAMMPHLSRRSGMSLERINGNFGMLFAISGLVSAPVGGLLIAWLGPVTVLWFNAATFAISAIAMLTLVPGVTRAVASGESFMSDLRVGLRYLATNRLLRTIVLLALAINFAIAPLFAVVLPVYANQELRSATALGIMIGGEGLGLVLGSFLYGRIAMRVRRQRLLVTSVVLIAVPLGPFALLPGVWPSAALLAVVGVGAGLVNPMIGTFLQQRTPEQLLGRVTGVFRAGALAAQPAGLLLGGLAVATLGLQATVAITAAITVLAAIACLVDPVMHRLDDPAECESSIS